MFNYQLIIVKYIPTKSPHLHTCSHLQAGLQHLLAALKRVPLGVEAAALKVLLEERNRKKPARQGGMRRHVYVR